MLKLDHLYKNYQGKQVLDNVSVVLNHGEKTALIGVNGAGKTTLLRILAGREIPDSGRVINEGEVVGYLSQEPLRGVEQTVDDYFISLGIDTSEAHAINRVFSRVRLDTYVLTIPCSALSEGQKTKVALASLLLTNPSVTALILDEPTNNLDLEGIQWLEQFIAHFPGLVLIVSHDRYLLNEVTTKIYELEDGICKLYGGNYTLFVEEKKRQADAYKRRYEEQEKKVRKLEESIKEITEHARKIEGETINFYFRKQGATIARRAVTQRSRLERSLESEERLEKPVERMKYSAKLRGDSIPEKVIFDVKNVSKRFGERTVLSDVSFFLKGGERVWLEGKNGSGKSTLLNIIRGSLKQDSGLIEFGNNVKCGYFAQEQRSYGPQLTVVEELQKTGVSESEVHKYAKRFLLKKEDMSKYMNTLSVGQQTKVEFIKLLLGSHQLLLLDEPTNHVEIQTRELIEEALSGFQGTILVSSHDRYFLEEIGITRTINIENKL